MIYTVTFNPSLDYVIEVKDFHTGTINRTVDEEIFAGGKGINVSIVLSNLGIDSTALGFVGGFTGDEIIRQLQDKGIHSDFIKVNGLSRINIKLRSNEESEINGMGPSIDEEAIAKLFNKLDTLKPGDYLILAGSTPSSIPQTIYMDIMKHLSGKGIRIVVDATRDLLKNVLTYKPFLIKPNNIELGDVFDRVLRTPDDVIPYAQKLQEMGATNVLVSLAGEGAVLVSEDGKVHKASAPKGTVINSVGAGDSMVAGFICGLIETNDYSKALIKGICSGSASAFSVGFGSPELISELIANYSNEY